MVVELTPEFLKKWRQYIIDNAGKDKPFHLNTAEIRSLPVYDQNIEVRFEFSKKEDI